MKELIIERAKPKDGAHITVTIKISRERFKKLSQLEKETNLSRTAILSRFIAYGIDNCKVIKNKSDFQS